MEEQAPLNNDQKPEPQNAIDPLEEAKRKIEEYLAGWQRAKADFANYKKDEAERMSTIVRYANQDFLEELIVVVDNFDLAIATLEKQSQADRGIYMIRSQLLDLLKKRGLERISIEIGKPFDPLISEPIAEIESDLPEGVVVEEIGAGYRLYEKVLRPARVKISKGQKTI